MDNVCHSLLGAALGKAGLARRTTLGMSTLVIASNLPDVDVAVFATNTLAMSFRRGWTHGVLAQATLPLVLAAAMVVYDRTVRRRNALNRLRQGCGESAEAQRAQAEGGPYGPAQFRELLLLSYIGVLAHVFLDLLNSYGVRLLMPFSNRWFYGDALYIIDPWMYLALGLGWWLSLRRDTLRQPNPLQPARIGLAVAAIYMLVMLGSNMLARGEVRDGLQRAGRPADTRFMVTPVFANPFRREVVIEVGDRYEKGALWFEPLPHFRPAGFGIAKGMNDPYVQSVLHTPLARAFLTWSRFPFVQVDRSTGREMHPNAQTTRVGGPAIWLNDYRYANAGPYGWSAVRIAPEPLDSPNLRSRTRPTSP